jgi:PAS domain S-box-containing protein
MGNDGRFFYVNQASCDALEYSKEELLEMTVHDIDPNFPKEIWENHWAELKKRGSFLIESHHQTKNGKIFPVELKVNHLEFAGNEYNCAFARNITDRKQHEKALRESEEKLARSKKMESLGLLAGGVAHDLNNVLSGIVSYPELILMDLPEDSKLRKPIETMQESGHRAAAIVQDLLTVARGVATSKGPLNLNDLIGDYLHSPEFNKLKQFYPTATVKTNFDKDLFKINGSIVHIRKMVMNLVSNAAEAIEGSGNVTISTINRYIDRPLRGYDDVNIGEYAILSVSDDGSGISSDDLERIFEPFYTKKIMGRSGTGLGLAVVWNTVQDHDGYINVKSSEKGTVFELYFPVTRDEPTVNKRDVRVEDYIGHKEKILVVDDEKTQREITSGLLTKLGYRVEVVSSGEEAVEYLKKNSADLIVLDMIMPKGMNGCETFKEIIKIHPNQKAIIASGFAETADVKAAQKLGAGKYIKKPYTMEKIGIAIKEELDNGVFLA